MSSPLHRCLAAVMALALALGVVLYARQIAAAEPLSIDIRQVDIGYGGSYKSGFWTPIWLTLRSPQGAVGIVEVMAPDGDGVPVAFAASGVGGKPRTELSANDDVTIHVLAKIGPERGKLAVRLRDDQTGKVLWQADFPASASKPLPATWELLVCLGECPAAAEAAGLLRRDEDHRVIAATLADAQHVPDAWWGWEGVQTIVLRTSRGNVCHNLTPMQWNALQQWVEIGGGRLVICAGEQGGQIVAAGTPLSELIPGQIAASTLLRDLRKLEELTGEPVVLAGNASRPPLTQLSGARGRVEAAVTSPTGEIPLIVRASDGFGEVVFLAIDPEGSSLAKWPGRARLFLSAIRGPGQHAAQSDGPRRAGSRLGYDDLTGQLRTAMDFFPSVRAVNITTVAILTLAYLVLIGPVDFFLLRRVGWPSIFTWFSFPVLVIAFCVLGWYAARAAHGQAVRANLAEIIDVDVERQIVRGTTWLHIYSPQTGAHNVSLKVDPAPIELSAPATGWAIWQGLPGNGLGGLAANQLAGPGFSPYQTDLSGQRLMIHNVPIQVAGTKSISARWWSRTNLGTAPPLSINQTGLLQGEVVNPLQVELRECLLVYDDWMYRLRTLSAGQRVRVSDFDMLNLEARLQQRTIANAKDVVSPWERDSTDVPRIMQMLMFHDSARGSTYTNLTHRYQSYLDLTPRARSGRAILVGRLARPVTELALDGTAVPAGSPAETWTWVRFVLPVSPPAKR